MTIPEDAPAATPFGAAPAITTDTLRELTPTEAFRQSVKRPRGFTFFLVLAMVGAAAAQMSAALLTLTLKATEIDAATATTTISISSAVAGILTLFALPIVGTLSDRTRSRFGRRRPYLVVGAIAFVLGAILLVTAPNVPVFVAAHLLITTGFVAANVTVMALLTDQLPADQRGVATALVSMSTPIGALFGMAVAVPFGQQLLPLVGIPTALAVIGMLVLAVVVRDPKWEFPQPPFDLRAALRVFWVNPLKHSAFTWVFTSRMLVFSGVAALNGYQAIYLLQKLHMEPAGLGTAILLTVVVNLGITMLVAPLVGKLSDRLGVRKPFILVAAVILAVGLVLASLAPDFGFYLVACTVVGLGQGVYFAVELVLATQVLPDPDNPAKDLGILKIADNLPVTIVAAAAPALLAIGAGPAGPNFAALFIAGAIAAVIGGLVILFVRGAR
ncbi:MULTISPECIES: MFS transporter [Microbacterium]|uniref:MFS transporter n=1 Tax=Microbacterium barkeri TaxID=33917 RepID=A0A9W6H2Y7_9MICO|nr:MFS transporter [Microbacterium barkeri]MDR6877358.1 MFS family permease [Microbacterium barkeri]GLJ61265.1 MFS transporter [Microbacterium barkeri]